MRDRDKNIGKFLLIPAVLVILTVGIYPLLYTFVMSFTNRGLLTKTWTFAGLDNFIRIFSESAYINAMGNTLVWVIATTSLEIIIGTAIALLLHRKFVFRNFARGLLLVPYVVPPIVTALLWRYMLNDLIGIVNFVLKSLHILEASGHFFTDPNLAMTIVVLANVWTYCPFVIISILASLQGINNDLYESARIDGASNFKLFTNITFPHIVPVLVMVTFLRAIWNTQKFDLIWLLTKGAPMGSTETIPILIFKEAFVGFRLSKPSALAVFIFVILVIFEFLFFKFYFKIEEKYSA